jgi:ATP-binding cassette subfamily F protein 3
MAEPHLLILDEPTNHLDIDSRRALLDALNDYEGAVIIVTHDRSLMELVADRLWLTADGTIKPFKGDMDDYARFVLERARAGSRPSQDDDTAAARPHQDGRHGIDHLADAKAVLSREQQAARQARYAAKKAAKLKRRESRR